MPHIDPHKPRTKIRSLQDETSLELFQFYCDGVIEVVWNSKESNDEKSVYI